RMRAESAPAGIVTSKIVAVPATFWKAPAGRSVQSVRVSEAETGDRLPNASVTRTVTVSGTPAVSRSVSGWSAILSGPPGETATRCREETNPVAESITEK